MTTEELELETRLVAYLDSTFREEEDPLELYPIVAGHTAAVRPTTYVCITCTGAGGELAHAGVQEVIVRALVMSQADDESQPTHAAAVAAVRNIFAYDELPALLAAISDETFSLSGWAKEGEAQEARDEEENKHGSEESWRAWCAFI